MFEKIKKQLPNLLTTMRLGMVGALPFIFIGGNPIVIIGTVALTLGTDFFDGYLARRWKVESDYGKKADAIADKAFGFSILTLSSIFINPIMLVPLAMEGIIASICIADVIKTAKPTEESSLIGRIKMFPLGITTVYSLLTMLESSLTGGLYVLCGITALLQATTAFVYGKRLVNGKKVNILEDKIFVPVKDNNPTEIYDKQANKKPKSNKEYIADLLKWRAWLELEQEPIKEVKDDNAITKKLSSNSDKRLL